MKIAYCIAGTYNSGGMERVLANKANYLVEHGHEVAIITTDQRGQKPFFALDSRIRCYDLGINYEENNGKSFLNKLLHYPAKQFRHKQRLTKLLKELKADIVISMFCNEAALLPSINDGSRKILEIHFSRFKRLQYARKGLWRIADNWRSRNDEKIAARYDKFVVLTHEDEAFWKGCSNICVIPNARTFTFEQPAPLTSKTVVAVGRYNYQKGFDLLIDAWSQVCRTASGWTLHIVGDGELRPAMEKQIAELGLQGKVVLRKAGSEEMREVYAGAAFLAMSSHYEGLPMVLLEAQAAGLPIVSFTCKCGPRDVVNDGETGFLVPEENVERLADAMLLLIGDSELRKSMGKRAFNNSEKFAVPTVMKQWETLFREVAG